MVAEIKTIDSMLAQIQVLRTEAVNSGDIRLVRDCDTAVEGRLMSRGCRAAVRRCMVALRS